MALGEILRQKRLSHGWTRDYVSERTHLMTRVIEALETENFKRIPAPVYGRGFIRQYCALLELDPKPLLDEYDAIVANGPRTTVTRPNVHDLPARPPEPIHTGGRRTLPPKPDAPQTPPPAPTHHKLVDSAEASFTAVPKPEALPGAERPPEPPPAPKPEPPRKPSPTQPAILNPRPAKRHRPVSGRAALADLDALHASPAGDHSIFGPQHPVPDPVSPQWRTLRDSLLRAGEGLRALFIRLTRPKVRPLGDGHPEPLISHRTLLQAATVLAVLIGLTILVLAFRYVFRLASDAQPDIPVTAQAPFAPRPVAEPPPPFFD